MFAVPLALVHEEMLENHQPLLQLSGDTKKSRAKVNRISLGCISSILDTCEARMSCAAGMASMSRRLVGGDPGPFAGDVMGVVSIATLPSLARADDCFFLTGIDDLFLEDGSPLDVSLLLLVSAVALGRSWCFW